MQQNHHKSYQAFFPPAPPLKLITKKTRRNCFFTWKQTSKHWLWAESLLATLLRDRWRSMERHFLLHLVHNKTMISPAFWFLRYKNWGEKNSPEPTHWNMEEGEEQATPACSCVENTAVQTGMKLSQTVTSELFFWWENFSICPSMGLLFLGNNSKCPEKNAFLRVHPELGIHWYHTHLSLTNTPIYHHPWMSTNSRFNWTTFSHSRLNIATLISVFPLWHRMMEWLGSRARIWGTWDLGIGACRSRKMPGGAQGRVVGVRSNLGKWERCQNPWFCRRVGCR